MKVIVCKEDESVIYNSNIYRHGESFEVDDAIGKSLIDRGYVAAADAAGEGDTLEGMSYPKLKKLAAEMGVAATGTKDELIERIRNAGETADETETEDEEESEGGEVEGEEESGETADELPNTDMPE